MIFTADSTPKRRSVRRSAIAAGAVGLVVSFGAAPAAVAATGAGHVSKARHTTVTPHARRPQIVKHVVRHHSAPPTVRNRAKAAREFGLVKPKSVHVVTSKVRTHPAKPAPIKPMTRKLPTVTPSYHLTTNVRLQPAIISGITGACQITAGNHSGTWSAAACPNGYEVQGDVTVPVGKTLTVKPNTVVYFDTTVAGSLTPGDVSELTDLIVDGTLTVAGTASQPVTFTSANAAPTSTVDAAAGDWGYVFFNHTGSNKGGGSLTHLRLHYGEGIAADKTAPAISASTITNVAAGRTAPTIASSIDKGAGIDYQDIPGGTVSLTNDTFDGGSVAGLDFESYYSHTDFSGTTDAGHPFTLTITGSAITGGSSTGGLDDTVYAESETAGASAAANQSAVTMNIHNDHITSAGNAYALDVEADSEPTTVAGTAAITGQFHDNVINTDGSSSGVYFYAYAADSTSSGTKTCAGASACVIVPFLADNISSYDAAVDTEAEVAGGGGRAIVSTPVGLVKTVKIKKKHHKTVIKHVEVSGGSITSTSDDGWDTYAYAYGTGAASVSMPIVKTPFDSYDNTIDSDVVSDARAATAKFPIDDSTLISRDDNNVVVETYGSETSAPPSGVSGSATADVTALNSTLEAEDNNIYYDSTYSYYGAANESAKITNSTLTSADDYNVEGDAYGSYQGGNGGGSATVAVTGSKLAAYDGAVDQDVYGYHGSAPATSTVTINKSTVDAYDESAVSSDAYSAYSTDGHGPAKTTASITNSKVQAYDYGMALYTYSYYGGTATSSPKITNSTVLTSEYAIENEVEASVDGGSGTATGSPAISGSTIDAEEYVIYNEVYGYHGTGTATGSPTITQSHTTSADDYLIYNEVEGPSVSTSSGNAVCNPQIVGGTAVSADYLIYNECYAYYGSGSGSPLIKNLNGIAGDDYGIYNEVYGSEDGGVGAATGNPKVIGTKLLAEDYVIYNEVYSYHGAGTGNPLISGSTVTSADDYLIYNEVYADYATASSSGHTATANPLITHSTAISDEYAIYNEAYGQEGPAVGNPAITDSTVTATNDYAMYNEVYGSDDGGSGSGTASPRITDSTVTAYEYPLYNEAYGEHGAAHANPVITKSPMKVLFDGGVYNEAYGQAGSATADPTLSSSPIYCGDCSSDYGLYNYADSLTAGASANPKLVSSPIQIPYGYGVYNEAYSATTSGSGTATAHPVLTSSSITAYDAALYNFAEGEHGNSTADASFTVSGGYLRTTGDEAIESEAEGSGTGKTIIDPNVSNATIRATDDDGVELYALAQGTGPTTVGGVVKNTSITSEDVGFYVELEPTGASPGTVTTSLTADPITSTDGEGVDVAATAKAASETLTPTISGGPITAASDDAIDVGVGGVGGASTDSLTSAPIISGVKMLSGDGISVYAEDSGGSASPGRMVVGGSVKNSTITSTDDDGIDAYAYCNYCQNGAKNTMVVSNTAIKAEDYGIFTESYAGSNSAGSAAVGGSTTSTTHSSITGADEEGVEAYAYSTHGGATNSYSVNGYTISGHYGPIYNYTYGGDGNAVRSGSLTNNKLVNVASTSDESGIYDAATASGAGHNVTATGSLSGNTISDLPTDSDGIYFYASSANQALVNVKIAHNTITNVGGTGIDVEASQATPPPTSDGVSITNNTIRRTGEGGLYVSGVKPTITANTISNTGIEFSTGTEGDGVYVTGAPSQGSLTCNVIFGNLRGVEYGTNALSGSSGHNGDPKTNNNSFRDPASSTRNSVDLKTGNLGSGSTDAQSNFWGGSPRLYAPSSRYDTSPKLTAEPKCAKTAGA